MHIKKLEIDNFKSFANKTEIPFEQGFTAIGGINGSGKSNIIDSILFALGLSSPRNLRTESGLSDLICTHNQRNDASVKVTFGLDDGKGSEISFTRKIKKGSQGYSSSYYMDDHPCTQSQMHAELEKYNVSPNSYNVIMQGDVTSLITCSSNERRKFIDEVAGTADFDRKIDAATKELDSAEARIKDFLLVLGQVETRCEELREEKEAALKYRELQASKEELENKISVVKYFDFKRTLEIVHQNILDSIKNQKTKEKEKDTIEELIKKQETEYKEISDKLKEEGEDKLLETKELANKKRGEISLSENSIAHTDTMFFENNKSIEGSKRAIEDFKAKINESNKAIKEKEAKKAGLENLLKEQTEKRDKILEEVTGLNKTADAYIKKRNELKKDLDELKEKENSLIKEKLQFESSLQIANSELSSAKEIICNLLKEKEEFTEKKDKLELQIEKLTSEKEQVKMLQKLTYDSLETNKNEISSLEHDVQLVNTKRIELQAKRSLYKSYGLGEGVELIMKSGLKGVHAPLSQLAEVDIEYQEAISEAMGGRSRNVVVDNDYVGAQAIELLKSRGAGKVTFLPLNKLRPAPTRLPLPKGEGVIDFAINLIDFDDTYLDAFYLALGETLIMQDMTSARKLMGKYRMVTLEGEIFEKTGAMTGGARKKNVVPFGTGDDKELQKCEEKLKEFADKNKELQNKKIEYEQRLRRCNNDYAEASSALTGANTELNVLINNYKKSEDLIKIQEDKIKEYEPEIKNLNAKLDKLEEKHITLNEKITTISDEIAEVEKFIDEGELNKLKELTKDIEEEIRNTENSIKQLDSEITKDENTVQLNNMFIEQKTTDIENTENKNKGLLKDKERFQNNIAEMKKELEELEAKIKELGAVFAEMQEKRDKIQNEQIETKNNKHIINNEIEKIKEQIESAKERRNTIEPQFQEVSDELKTKGVDVKTVEPETMTTEEINSKIQKLQKRMDELGLVNMRAIETYDSYAKQQADLKEKIDTLEKEKSEIQTRMTGYENLKKETFLTTYNKVSEFFSSIFTELTNGTGRLVLENQSDPFAGGLTIEAQLGTKPKQKLTGLSGGEKTLTALSLIFAVQEYHPSPFYALDEVDAALDGFNVERIANKIANLPKEVQFVVISQRQQMHERADRMIGVHQGARGATQVSGIRLTDREKEIIAG